jgi:hypothetical protein
VRVILLAAALVYASLSMLAEVEYATAAKGGDLENVINKLRLAHQLWPLDHRFRSASALVLGDFAFDRHNPDLDRLAAAEIAAALKDDPNSIELLILMLSFGRTDYQAQFDRVARFPLPHYLDLLRSKHVGGH